MEEFIKQNILDMVDQLEVSISKSLDSNISIAEKERHCFCWRKIGGLLDDGKRLMILVEAVPSDTWIYNRDSAKEYGIPKTQSILYRASIISDGDESMIEPERTFECIDSVVDYACELLSFNHDTATAAPIGKGRLDQ